MNNKILHVHASKLRPFEYHPRFVDPRVVANKEQKVYDIEEILSNTGNKNKKSSQLFKVKWVGYDTTDCTYETWSTLRRNEVLHRYLIKIGWKANVPKQYRFQYPDIFPNEVGTPIHDAMAVEVHDHDDLHL